MAAAAAAAAATGDGGCDHGMAAVTSWCHEWMRRKALNYKTLNLVRRCSDNVVFDRLLRRTSAPRRGTAAKWKITSIFLTSYISSALWEHPWQEQLHGGVVRDEANLPCTFAACTFFYSQCISRKCLTLKNVGQGYGVNIHNDLIRWQISTCIKYELHTWAIFASSHFRDIHISKFITFKI